MMKAAGIGASVIAMLAGCGIKDAPLPQRDEPELQALSTGSQQPGSDVSIDSLLEDETAPETM